MDGMDWILIGVVIAMLLAAIFAPPLDDEDF
jgi:hypothetical protein